MHILWLKTELLHPVDKGGRIRTYHMLRELKARHRITYLTLDDGADPGAAERAGEYCDRLIRVPFRATRKYTPRFYATLAMQLLLPLPYTARKYRSSRMRDAVADVLRQGDVDVLVCDFLAPSVNVPDGVGCPTLLFQHNVEAVIWQRHYAVARNPLKRWFLHSEWRKMRAFERRECARYDAVVAVSEVDRATIAREYHVSTAHAVPTGVDTEYFKPTGNVRADPLNLIFTGSMDWLPNQDAVRFFAREILPRVRAQVPDVTFTVVGRNPGPDLHALARAHDIRVTGRVEDVRPYLEAAALFVVPLRIGGGTRLKIFEAMAMGLPIVSTTVGAEGLPVRDGVHLVLRDDPAAFAGAVTRLLQDPISARALASRGEALVRERFSWSAVAAEFVAICEQTVAAQDIEAARTLTLEAERTTA